VTTDVRRVRPSSEVLFKELDGEAVLLGLADEQYFGLNAVATRMWTLLASSESVEEAYRALLEEYDVEPATLRKDLDALIDELRDRKLVRVSGV
jgi:hypothetical protein